MPKLELHKVGFVNPSTPAETVVLSTILEGAGGATRSFVEEEPEAFVFEDDQEIKDGQVFTFTMAGKPNSDKAQLVSWADAGTELTIVGYSYNESVLIENAILSYLPDSSERLTWKITAQKSGKIGYQDGKLGTEFMMSKNLLNMYYWQEGSTDIAAGWSKSGGSTVWDSINSEQDFTTTGAADVFMYREVYFPFAKQVTFRVNVDAISVSSGVTIEIQAKNEGGSFVGTDATETISSTGVASVTRTLPSTTNLVRVRIVVGQNDSISFSDPALNLGTSTEYTSQ